MERITYWKKDRLISKKFKTRGKAEKYIKRKGIKQYYLWGWCWLEVE